MSGSGDSYILFQIIKIGAALVTCFGGNAEGVTGRSSRLHEVARAREDSVNMQTQRIYFQLKITSIILCGAQIHSRVGFVNVPIIVY